MSEIDSTTPAAEADSLSPAYRLASLVLSMDLITDKGVRSRELARLVLDAEEKRLAGVVAPVDVLLYCPQCGDQHVDAPEASGWTNPPHRSHRCHRCRYIWRPADVPTNGVETIATRGKDDAPAKPWHARTRST